MDISFLSGSPDNKQVEDCAFTVRHARHISDDTTVFVSKLTTIGDGGLYRFVQMQHDGEALSFAMSFDDNFGMGPQWYQDANKSVRRVKMSWMMVTDADLYTSIVKTAVHRFSPELMENIDLEEQVSEKSVWEHNARTLHDTHMVKELEGILDNIIPKQESVNNKSALCAMALEHHQQQIDMHKYRMTKIMDNMSRYD